MFCCHYYSIFVVVIFAWETTKNMKKEQNRRKVTSKPNIYSQVLHIQNKNVMNTSVLSYTGKKKVQEKVLSFAYFLLCSYFYDIVWYSIDIETLYKNVSMEWESILSFYWKYENWRKGMSISEKTPS